MPDGSLLLAPRGCTWSVPFWCSIPAPPSFHNATPSFLLPDSPGISAAVSAPVLLWLKESVDGAHTCTRPPCPFSALPCQLASFGQHAVPAVPATCSGACVTPPKQKSASPSPAAWGWCGRRGRLLVPPAPPFSRSDPPPAPAARFSAPHCCLRPWLSPALVGRSFEVMCPWVGCLVCRRRCELSLAGGAAPPIPPHALHFPHSPALLASCHPRALASG